MAASRGKILEACGILLGLLGVLHLAATRVLLNFYRTIAGEAAYAILAGPTALNHILVGVLLLPLGYMTWLAGRCLPAWWAKRLSLVSSSTVASFPVLLALLMRNPRYLHAPPFMVAVGLTLLISLLMLYAALSRDPDVL